MANKISSPDSKAGLLPSLLVLLSVALFSFLGISQQSPPRAVPATAPPTEFSSERALQHLGSIARKPHPMGTDEHAAVRDYLLSQLTALGLSPEIQETTEVNSSWGIPFRAGTVQNILARLEGTSDGKAVLLAGHYDSVANGPGASDDGAALASMLETLRALKAGSPLKNDVIFFFSDGEEAGLLGANAFIHEHAWAKDVGLVLNFEARGNRGASIMFETSQQNGWLIDEFARAAPHAVANSLAYEIYSRLPKDTDLSVFKGAGVQGFNFAYINGLTHYHTALDNTQNIDQRSLQHHGSYALALTRHFGNLALQNPSSRNAVYFDIFGRTLVHYSEAWVVVFAVLTSILFLAVVIYGWRKRHLSLGKIALAFLAFIIGTIINAVVITLIWLLVETLHSGYQQMHQGVTYNSHFYTLGFVFLTLALASAQFVLLRKRLGMLNLSVGALACWMLAVWLMCVSMPGASYLFTWPLFFSLLGLGYNLYTTDHANSPTKLSIALSLAALPALVLVVPAIYHISNALALFMSGAVMLLTALLVGLLLQHLDIITSSKRWILPVASLVVALLFIVAGALTSGFNRERPRPDNVFYGLDADSQQAIWASLDDAPDEWTSQFFPANATRGQVTEFLPLITVDFMKTSAPLSPLPPPELTLLSDNANVNGRTLRLRLTSPRRAPLVSVYLDPQTQISNALVNGKPVGHTADTPADEQTRWGLLYAALPADGIELTLEMKTSQPVKLRVIDLSYGLPQPQTQTLRARPDHIISTFLPFSDSTLVSKSFTF